MAIVVSLYMAYSGYKKGSLSFSGSIAAVFVGFVSMTASYRFGVILILFYYSGSKLTKYKSGVKAKIEDGHTEGGNRDAIQVYANSILATIIALAYFFTIGDDVDVCFAGSSDQISLFGSVNMSRQRFGAYLWTAYVAHYATAAGDTWASELGVLSSQKPRLITSFFLREVPPGTNGGVSLLGTIASICGGTFIGHIFWSMSGYKRSQFPMVLVGLISGFMGSMFDSLLGATVQATYYCTERKLIVKSKTTIQEVQGRKVVVSNPTVTIVSGLDFISNEFVNFLSIFVTMLLSLVVAEPLFCFWSSEHC